ncbi:hypothetical protein PENSTE_c011G07445 [Penicillium steckii]|uniref:Uncharacterized protein n=1 Tax=Penicillium steckii TaxID=303698 RepID=A0A1V6T5Z6_9EURO|nr:hypothetical protein PENSTE_c011G07445 [Penicillium steckii]
MFGLFFNVYI